VADEGPQYIQCGPHGRRVAAVVCGHLVGPVREPRGFVENSADPDDLQGWCLDCEALFQQEDGMTATFRRFTDMTIVCDACYRDIKARHALPEA
jgi:hypothetical protein